MFQMEFKDVSQNGAYRLDSISYTAGGQEYSASFEEMGIEASFGVNEIVENTILRYFQVYRLFHNPVCLRSRIGTAMPRI